MGRSRELSSQSGTKAIGTKRETKTHGVGGYQHWQSARLVSSAGIRQVFWKEFLILPARILGSEAGFLGSRISDFDVKDRCPKTPFFLTKWGMSRENAHFVKKTTDLGQRSLRQGIGNPDLQDWTILVSRIEVPQAGSVTGNCSLATSCQQRRPYRRWKVHEEAKAVRTLHRAIEKRRRTVSSTSGIAIAPAIDQKKQVLLQEKPPEVNSWLQ